VSSEDLVHLYVVTKFNYREQQDYISPAGGKRYSSPNTPPSRPDVPRDTLLVLLPVPVEALEAREHEDIVVRLLVELTAPIPRRGEPPVDAGPAVVPCSECERKEMIGI
jgi:hypothetical protein